MELKDREEDGSAAGPGPSSSGRGGDATSDLPVLQAVQDYEKITRIGEGTYGIVCECQAPSQP